MCKYLESKAVDKEEFRATSPKREVARYASSLNEADASGLE